MLNVRRFADTPKRRRYIASGDAPPSAGQFADTPKRRGYIASILEANDMVGLQIPRNVGGI